LKPHWTRVKGLSRGTVKFELEGKKRKIINGLLRREGGVKGGGNFM